ncbi:MAG: PAS domain S-box protein [Chlorobium sp.]|nr:MAG: PAS domain S-box protein [Chlorobium sp.]
MKKGPADGKREPKKKEENIVRQKNESPFPVIGIGSSAGGLEALEAFLKNVPSPCGMAFVIVQHLDPAHKGIMVELLQRVTSMPVLQVSDRLKIQPDHVYVIPPNHDMTILHRSLHLLDIVKTHGLKMPIDFFFRSMALDLEHRSIGVILSGMGSDGTLGLRAIKEKGGGVFVQDPLSAKFDGMPRSAIDSGLADIIAPVEELPARISAYLKHVSVTLKPIIALEDRAVSSLEKIVILLRSHTGHDFSLYKKNTIYRRIERRMGIHQIEKISDYVRFLQKNPDETELLFKELLIGVTSFFRNPEAWDILKTKAIPQLIASHPAGRMLRAWVAGCSTGEEAYSLAIVFREVLDTVKPSGNFKLQIFATDLDRDAIDKARAGLYPPNITADVSPERISRFFKKEDNGEYKISKEIRETIVFAQHNIIMDPPFTKLDILICRNLLIYLEQELQKKLIPLFHYSLNTGGILFLGIAETIGSSPHLFEVFDNKNRLFRQLRQGIRQDSVEFPVTVSFSSASKELPDISIKTTPMASSESSIKSLTEQLLLDYLSPAAVLTNDKGDIVYIYGRTGKYLEPAAGKANLNVFAMAREGMRYELSLLFGNVLRQKGSLTKKGLSVGTNGGTQCIDLTVKLIDKPNPLKGMVMIVFTDVSERTSPVAESDGTISNEGNAKILSLHEELKQAKDEILAIREEMQTSQEELNSTNEELQSSNEEMQSTNEELTTSKEEMQSLNEELQTVNQELQSKVTDLSQANNDMKNLLNSTDIATLFLDDELNIRRFTTRMTSIIKLIASDIGRPVTDIVTDLDYPALAEDGREVLRSLVFSEKQVAASDNRWFTVKIMPYRTEENRIDGLVITFNDITKSKELEKGLRQSKESFQFLIDTMPVGCIFQDSKGRIEMVNHEAEEITGISAAEMLGKTMDKLQWKLVRTDGSVFPVNEHPAIIALQTRKNVREVVMGLMRPDSGNCRWIKVSSAIRSYESIEQNCYVYTTFFEIAGPQIP